MLVGGGFVGSLGLTWWLRPWAWAFPQATLPPTATPWFFTGPLPPTATPFRAYGPTPARLPTMTPLPTATPPFADRILILLLGSDMPTYTRWYRTDTIMLAVYNPRTGALSLVSFPRDLYVAIPGMGYNRINTVMEFGGFDLMAETLARNFGIRPRYYILVSRFRFKEIIDTLGGLEVYVSEPLCDQFKNRWHCVEPGLHYMDADEALWYARSRRTSNDFKRIQRQQQVVKALIHKLISMDALRRAPELYRLFRDAVQTNIGPQEMVYLAFQARRFDPEKVYSYPIQEQHVTPWIKPSGAYVLLPNQNAIRALLDEAFSH